VKKVFLFFALIFISACSDQIENKEDCISRIEFIWLAESNRDKNRVIVIFMNAFVTEYTEIYGHSTPPPSSAVQGENSEFIYLQYTDFCEDKYRITKHLTDKIAATYPNLPELLVSNQKFKPSINTIAVDGPYWKHNQEGKD